MILAEATAAKYTIFTMSKKLKISHELENFHCQNQRQNQDFFPQQKFLREAKEKFGKFRTSHNQKFQIARGISIFIGKFHCQTQR